MTVFNRPPNSHFEWSIHVLHDILLEDCGHNTLLNRIFSYATPKGVAHGETLDPLMRMLGFNDNDMPDVSQHQYSGAMGQLFERLVKSIFANTRPKLYSDDWKSLAEKHNITWETRQGKRWADLLLGNTAIELKYRYASGESADKQGQAAEKLKAIGCHPVMLVLRPSRNTHKMASYGWDVRCGNDAISYIEKHSGVNLSQLVDTCQANPLFAQHTTQNIQKYHDRWNASARALVLNMDSERKISYIKDLLSHLPAQERSALLCEMTQ